MCCVQHGCSFQEFLSVMVQVMAVLICVFLFRFVQRLIEPGFDPYLKNFSAYIEANKDMLLNLGTTPTPAIVRSFQI